MLNRRDSEIRDAFLAKVAMELSTRVGQLGTDGATAEQVAGLKTEPTIQLVHSGPTRDRAEESCTVPAGARKERTLEGSRDRRAESR